MAIYAAGEIIAQEGSEKKEIFVLMRGSVGIYKGDLKIAEFSEVGTVVGEMSIILNQPRTATIKALEDSDIICVKADLPTLIKEYPVLTRDVIKGLAERLKITTEDYWNVAAKTGAFIEFDDV